MTDITIREIGERLRLVGYDVTECEDAEFIPPTAVIYEITNVEDIDNLRETVHALHGDEDAFVLDKVDALNDEWYTVTLWEAE